MTKTFEYFRKTGECYVNGEWDGDDGYYFEYTPDKEDVLNAICNLLNETYFKSKLDNKKLKQLVCDCDIEDVLIERFDSELHDLFEEKAIESLAEY